MTDRRSWKVLGRLIWWNAHRTMSHYYIFPTLVQPQRSGERHLIRFWRRWQQLGLQPFLIYPAVIKLRHKGEQKSFDSPQKAEDFISSLSQQKTYAAALREGNGKTAATISPARREGLDGREGGGPSCPGGDDGRMDMDAFWTCFLFFLLSSLLLGYCPYLYGTTISLLVRLTPFFLFWRGLMESRFNYIYFLAVWAFRGTCLALEWIGHVPSLFFCCLKRPTFSVMCGLSCFLFMVVGCSCLYVVFIFYNRHLYFYLFYPISKRIFHLGGLKSKMHISVYVLFTEWKCFCFFFHLLNTILGLWIFNAYSKYFITECEWFKFCC